MEHDVSLTRLSTGIEKGISQDLRLKLQLTEATGGMKARETFIGKVRNCREYLHSIVGNFYKCQYGKNKIFTNRWDAPLKIMA